MERWERRRFIRRGGARWNESISVNGDDYENTHSFKEFEIASSFCIVKYQPWWLIIIDLYLFIVLHNLST